MKTKFISTILLSLVVTIGLFAQSQGQTNSVTALKRIARLMAQGYSFLGDNQKFRGYYDGMLIVKHNGKFGFVNEEGNLIVPCRYDKVLNFSNGIACVGIKKIRNKFETDTVVQDVMNKQEIQEKMYWGLIDKSGKEILSCDYEYFVRDRCKCFPELFKAEIKYNNGDSKIGFVNSKGEVVIPIEYDRCDSKNYFANGKVVLSKDRNNCLIDKNGNIIVPLGKYLIDERDDDGTLGYYICEKKKYGLMDSSGKIIIPCEYDELCIKSFFKGDVLALIKKEKVSQKENKHVRIAVNNGIEILPEVYDDYVSLGYSLKVKKGNLWYFITHSGKAIKYDLNFPTILTYKMEHDLFVVKKDNKMALMDSEGKIIFSSNYQLSAMHDGYKLSTGMTHKEGYVNKNGKIIIPCVYDEIRESINPNVNLICLKKDAKYGCIDRLGHQVIPFLYSNITIQKNGNLLVNIDNRYDGPKRLLTRKGVNILSYSIEDVGDYESELIIPIKRGGKWGYADLNGHTTFDYNFDGKQLEQDNSESSVDNKNADKEDKKQEKKKKKSKFINFLNNVLEGK